MSDVVGTVFLLCTLSTPAQVTVALERPLLPQHDELTGPAWAVPYTPLFCYHAPASAHFFLSTTNPPPTTADPFLAELPTAPLPLTFHETLLLSQVVSSMKALNMTTHAPTTRNNLPEIPSRSTTASSSTTTSTTTITTSTKIERATIAWQMCMPEAERSRC